MNLNDISTQLLFTTVPIWIEKASGQMSTGTAFFYNYPVPKSPGQFIPLVVTNHHVVQDARRGLIELVEREADRPKQTRIRVEISGDIIQRFVDDKLDLAAIPIGPVLNQLENAQKPVIFRSIGPELIPTSDVWNDLAALEEIVFIGYPSGLRDEQSGMPIVRRGITATPAWNAFENRPVFLIDAGVFPGSSGSPVFILNQGAYTTRDGLALGNRLLFLGAITETMLRPEGAGMAYLGLGKVVKSSAIAAFIEVVVKKAQPEMA